MLSSERNSALNPSVWRNNFRTPQKIVFSERNIIKEGGSDLWIVNPDGTGLRKLVDGLSTQNGRLQFSPDSQYVAFQCNDEFPSGVYKIKIADLGGNILYECEPSNQLVHFSWFPNSKSLSLAVPGRGIFTCDLGKEEMEQIVENSSSHVMVTVSPDSEDLVFASIEYDESKNLYSLYRVNISSGALEKIGDAGVKKFTVGERLDIHWITPNEILFSVQISPNSERNRVRRLNIETKVFQDYQIASLFDHTSLSPNLETLVLFGGVGEGLRFFKTKDFFAGNATPFKSLPDEWSSLLAWSRNSDYFITSDVFSSIEGLRIFDYHGNKIPLKIENLSADADGDIVGLDWSQADITEVPLSPPVWVPKKIQGEYGKIAFYEGSVLEREMNLWIVNPDGSQLKKFSHQVSIGRMRFSPNGKYLAFNGAPPLQEVVMDLEGRIVYKFNAEPGRDISWTPNGESILFGLYLDRGIFRFDLGGGVTSLFRTGFETYDHDPVMSPNLDKIIFTNHAFGSVYDLNVLDLKTSMVTTIANGTTRRDDESLDTTWIDNTHLFYKTGSYLFSTLTNNSELHYIDLAQGDHKKIDARVFFTDSRVSPDKSKILLYGQQDSTLVEMREVLDGAIKHPELIKVGWANGVGWSRDSKYFVIGGGLYGYPRPYLRMFDTEGREYIFLTPEDFPEQINDIQDVDWSHE